MLRQDTKLESEGAEFLVLGHLLMHRIPSYKTYTNMPGYDLVATDPQHNSSARIQVKSRWRTGAPGFIIKNFDCEFVVVVKLNRGKKDGSGQVSDPEYYVFPVEVLRDVPRSRQWSKIQFSTIPEMQKFRDGWERIRAFLCSPTRRSGRTSQHPETPHAGRVSQQHAEIGRLLLSNRDDDAAFWEWIKPGQSPTRKEANKFLLGCILDYQMRAEMVWAKAKRLAEVILNDPTDLWGTITSVSLDEWRSKRAEYALHRFPKAHDRVYTIGERIVKQYQSDARRIWSGQEVDVVLDRLVDIGIGEQISRMVVGALNDTGIVTGIGDVKADIHVRRVLGRLLRGKSMTADQAVEATRQMWPANPWLLDRPLYRLGKSVCIATDPHCDGCAMRRSCVYGRSTR